MKKNIFSFLVLLNIILITPANSADIGIGGFIQRPAYTTGQTIDFLISGFNIAANAEKVDVHIGLIAADGTIYEYPNWNTSLTPWLANFSIPANFQLPVTLLGNFDSFPGGLQPGAYQFAVALTSPGTLNILSFETRAFKIVSLNNTVTSGGISFGHGQSPTGITPPVANAAGGFLNIDINDSAQLQSMSEGITVDIEQCLFDKVAPTLDSNLDAGDSLTLSSVASGNATLVRVTNSSGDVSYGVDPSLVESFYIPSETYTVIGTGGSDIAAFNVSATAPAEVIITSPDLTTLESLDSSQDLNLRWQGNNGVGEIEVTLQVGFEPEAYRINCRFADDGEAIITSNLLVQLRDSVPQNSTPIPDFPGFELPELIGESRVSMVFSRNRIEFINNNDNDGTLFLVSWALGLAPEIR